MKKDSIKTLFKKLSNINIDIDDDFLLTPNQFNSIQLDKFISELKNIGINWNGNIILIIQQDKKHVKIILMTI
jgi:hypothetical protein